MTKFKVGDKVKIVSIDFLATGDLKNKDIGTICTITEVFGKDDDDDDVYILDDNRYGANFTEKSLQLAKTYKPKTPTHVVVWDEGCGDPCKFFTSEKEAKEFMKELSDKSGVLKESVILVEIKSAQKVKITKTIRLVGHKI